MSKLSKPLDIPLRGSKKSFVGIGRNILSNEENSVELVIGKPVIYSKSVKKEISIDKIYSLSPSLESGTFTSESSLQSLPLAEEVSVPKKLESEGFSVLLSLLSASNKENIASVPAVSVRASESAKETPCISLHAISEPILIPFSSKSIGSIVSESFADDTFPPVTGSDKNSEIVTILQSDLEVNKKIVRTRGYARRTRANYSWGWILYFSAR